MKKILKFLWPYWKGLIGSSISVLTATLCNLLLPTIMSEILNNGVYGKDLDYILRCCAVMLLVAMVSLGMTLLGSWISNNVVESFCCDLRNEIFRRVNSMTFEEFGRHGAAALVTRGTHDVQTVSWIAAELSGTVMTIPALFFGGVIMAMRKDVILALTLLAFVPVILAIVIRLGKWAHPLWVESDEYIDRQNDIMRQRLRGIRVIRAFNSEPKEQERIAGATRLMADNIIKSNVSMGLISPLASLLLNNAVVLIVYLGGARMELGGGLSAGDVFAVVQYVSLVASGIIMGSFAVVMYPHAQVASGRISQVLDSEVMADPIAPQNITFSGRIELDDVTFSYHDGAEPALSGLSFVIEPGEKVAVIGGTGSGKSTLVSILMGFREPSIGCVRFDGIPFRQLSRYTIRDNISCVLQNATIYSGTIRENVRMGKQDASDQEVWKALEIAQAADFVRAYPDGLDHEVKQSGKNLSGGQKQRLSIARAVLKNAPIFIFDDSFSALDFLTEARLRRALSENIGGKTQIIITQRVASAMHCRRIFVMDRGRIVDMGTHSELLSRCQVYREIHASQTGGEA